MLFQRTLERQQYRNLWNRHFRPIISDNPPPYDEFTLREECFKDYLLRIAWGGLKIKYILIAELPPPPEKTNPITRFEKLGNYIYNENSQSEYLMQPLRAFYNDLEGSILNAKNFDTNLLSDYGLGIDDLRLDGLAEAGVLILDLFPFGITLDSSIRRSLNSRGVTLSFFNDYNNPYSIYSRLEEIRDCCPELLDLSKTPNTAFIAPPIISDHLGLLANNSIICERYSLLQVRKGLHRKNKSPHYFSGANPNQTPSKKLIQKALLLR